MTTISMTTHCLILILATAPASVAQKTASQQKGKAAHQDIVRGSIDEKLKPGWGEFKGILKLYIMTFSDGTTEFVPGGGYSATGQITYIYPDRSVHKYMVTGCDILDRKISLHVEEQREDCEKFIGNFVLTGFKINKNKGDYYLGPMEPGGDVKSDMEADAGTRARDRLKKFEKDIAKDPVGTVAMYRKSADLGDAESQCNLGRCYALGLGLPKDETAAAQLWHKAADQGNARGQYNLGSAYQRGAGVPKDDVMAYMWWSLAAVSGDDDGRKSVEIISERMTKDQIAEARRLSKEWKPTKKR